MYPVIFLIAKLLFIQENIGLKLYKLELKSFIHFSAVEICWLYIFVIYIIKISIQSIFLILCVFFQWCSRDSRCKKLQLTDLLVSPVQHIMRVPLILKEIEMRTEDSSEKKVISNIIESEENSLS